MEFAFLDESGDNKIKKEKTYLKELQETKKGLMQDLLIDKVRVNL